MSDKHAGGRPHRYTVDEFRAKWNEYLQQPTTTAPRVLDFCIFADMSRDTFDAYKNKPEYSDTCKKILAVCENTLVSMLYDNNRRNIIGPIFALKNNYGWKDKQEIDQNISGDLSINITIDD